MLVLKTDPSSLNDVVTKLKMKGYSMIEINPKDVEKEQKADAVVITDALPVSKLEVTHAKVEDVPDKVKSAADGAVEEPKTVITEVKANEKKLPTADVSKQHVTDSLKIPGEKPIKMAEPDEDHDSANSRFSNNIMKRGIGW